MDLLQKDVPILTKIYEAKCFYDSQNNRIILYYKNHVTGRTLVDFYNLPTTPPPNSSLYVIYDLQTGTFNVSTDPPTYTVSNSKVYVTSPINAEYDMDKVIIYRISWYETDTDIDLNYILTQLNTIDLNHILTQLNTFDTFVREQQANTNHILEQLNTFVRKQQADTITAIHTFDPTQPGPAFQLGLNAQNQLIQYLNADKVDGFDVSQTPAPNTIPVALPTGKLDIGWLPVGIGSGGYSRVDLTGATSDYNLQVGEEAIIRFTNRSSVPLRIATQSGTYYECHLVCSNTGGTSGASAAPVFLNPNNTTYSNAFVFSNVYRDYGGMSSAYITYSAFRCGWAFVNNTFYITNYTQYKNLRGFSDVYGTPVTFPTIAIFSTDWRDTTTSWTSLGTITFAPSTSGYILVRRLV